MEQDFSDEKRGQKRLREEDSSDEENQELIPSPVETQLPLRLESYQDEVDVVFGIEFERDYPGEWSFYEDPFWKVWGISDNPKHDLLFLLKREEEFLLTQWEEKHEEDLEEEEEEQEMKVLPSEEILIGRIAGAILYLIGHYLYDDDSNDDQEVWMFYAQKPPPNEQVISQNPWVRILCEAILDPWLGPQEAKDFREKFSRRMLSYWKTHYRYMVLLTDLRALNKTWNSQKLSVDWEEYSHPLHEELTPLFYQVEQSWEIVDELLINTLRKLVTRLTQ